MTTKKQQEQKQSQNAVEVTGRVSKIFYSKPEFSAGVLIEATSGRRLRFSGKVFLKEGEQVIIKGSHVTDPKYGPGFLIESFCYNQQLSIGGLADYLVSCKIKGIGEAKAKKIAKAYGDKFEETLMNSPGDISALVNISLEDIEKLKQDWINKRDYAHIFTKLAGYGISAGQCNKLITHYGASIFNVLLENPYSLIGKISGFGFKRIDLIARNVGIEKTDPGRIRACLLYLLQENEDKGNCWIDRKELIDQANRDLIIDSLDSKQLIANEIDKLSSNVILFTRVYKNDTIAIKETYNQEKRIFNIFKTNSINPVFSNIPSENINKLLENQPYSSCNEKQREAIDLFIKHNQVLISGLAGGGKTWTLHNIVKVCQHYNKEFILLSPTGKAARRLQQYTGIPAYTIHRACGYRGEGFSESIPLLMNAEVIIVDELSMVSVPLLYALLTRIDFNRKCIVFAGDHNQLPCIGTGNILKDILDRNLIPNIILNKCVRQAGLLKENCNKILEGTVEPTAKEFIGTTNRKPWYKIITWKTDKEIRAYIEEIYKNSITEKLGFNIEKDVQLLTPTHKGCLGTYELNKLIQRILQKKLYNVDVPETSNRFYVYDRVIQMRNNYDLDVMNGTIGQIIEYTNNNNLIVQYEDKTVKYENDDIEDLSLANCLTIHKVQGDEFPLVIVINHKSHCYQHNRNLLYTGVTRARQTAVILGDLWSVTQCVKKTDANKRNTFLRVLV